MAVDLDVLLPVLLEDLRQRFGLVLLRPVTFPLAVDADVDALVDPTRRDDLLRGLLAWAADHGLSVTCDRTHGPKLGITIHDGGRDRDYALEIWSHIEVKDPAGRGARAIPWERLAPHRERPDLLPLLYLGHLATKGKDPAHPSVRARLEHWQDVPGPGEQMAALLAGTTTVAEAAAWANARLLDLGILPPASTADTVAHRARARARHARRARVATGIVAVTGPDGAGKGTVIGHLRATLSRRSSEVRFKNLFRHHPGYKVLVARHGRAPGEEKNQWDERHARSLFALARHGWPLLRLRAALGRVLWCDRYWHDLLFEGLRLRQDTPRLTPDWRRNLARLPIPGWHLHLDAPDAVILSRKDELPAAALPVYRAGMIDLMLAADEPLFTVLNTGGSLEETLVAARRAAQVAGLR